MLNLMREISRMEFMTEVLKGMYSSLEGSSQDYYEAYRKFYYCWYYSGYSATVMRRDLRSDYLDLEMPNLSKHGRERSKYYNKGFEHDDRTMVPHDGTRRVSFKNHGRRNNKHNRQRGWDSKIRALLQDDDVEMNCNSRSSERYIGCNEHIDREVRYNNYRATLSKLRVVLNNNANVSRKQRRGFHQRLDRPSGRRFLTESPSYWYKVTIRYGGRYEKDYLLKLLGNYIKPLPFIPIGYKVTSNDATFTIEDHNAAEELLNADKRITVNDGFKINLQVRSFNPLVEIGSKITETMTKVMSSRYNPYTKALDLSKFHLDTNFLSENIFCPLNKENVMLAVIGIIYESIPDLVALDLSNNKLSSLNCMKSMVEKVASLKILHIGQNKIRDIKQLDALKGLNLEELVVDGNSLCDKFTSKDEYIRAVRQRFPKVIKLDYVELPPPILFDVEDEDCKLPPSQASFMCDPDRGASVVRAFLEQYYQIYDSDSREALIQAYHDSAQFSLDCVLLPGQHSSTCSAYLPESRNLFRVPSIERRIKLLKVGKNKIVEALKSLPNTQHDPTSFVVDLVLFTPVLIELNVCGLFKEKDKADSAVKYFNRLFVIVPVGTGFCIVNEMLTIMLATPEQVKKVAKLKEVATASISIPVAPGTSTALTLPVELDLATKHQMVTALSLKSGMNLIWSEKCLAETNWNFDQALNSFLQLQKTGSIPAEAFQK
ncbi:nuclear RNA export factor 1-like isoform X2 [Rhodnius prolixus]